MCRQAWQEVTKARSQSGSGREQDRRPVSLIRRARNGNGTESLVPGPNRLVEIRAEISRADVSTANLDVRARTDPCDLVKRIPAILIAKIDFEHDEIESRAV